MHTKSRLCLMLWTHAIICSHLLPAVCVLRYITIFWLSYIQLQHLISNLMKDAFSSHLSSYLRFWNAFVPSPQCCRGQDVYSSSYRVILMTLNYILTIFASSSCTPPTLPNQPPLGLIWVYRETAKDAMELLGAFYRKKLRRKQKSNLGRLDGALCKTPSETSVNSLATGLISKVLRLTAR